MNADFFNDDMAGLPLLVEVNVTEGGELGTLNFFMASSLVQKTAQTGKAKVPAANSTASRTLPHRRVKFRYWYSLAENTAAWILEKKSFQTFQTFQSTLTRFQGM
jgi:hypothetical protein